MKLVYLVDVSLTTPSGVLRKVEEQVTYLRRLGAKVTLLSSCSSTDDGIAQPTRWYRPPSRSSIGRFHHHATRLRRLVDELERLDFDLIYSRMFLWCPALERLAQKYPVLLEINSDDRAEFATRGLSLTRAFHLLTRYRLLRLVKGLVFVTPELAMRFRSLNLPSTVITNAHAVSDRFVSDTGNSKPHIFFSLNRVQPWHGLDILAELARFLNEVVITVAGAPGITIPNIRCLGKIAPETHSDLIAGTDVAVSSLALFRNGMNQACPLKSREALAYGVPLIYGYNDPDLEGDLPFVLKLPNREGGIGRQECLQVRAFVQRCFRDAETRRQARDFASSKLNPLDRERQRLKFFEDILTAERSRSR